MKNKNISKLLILSILIIIAYFLGLYVSPALFANKYNKLAQQGTGQETYDFPDLEASKIKAGMPIEDIIAGKNDYWSNWDWETQMFYAGVSGFAPEEKEVVLYMMRPENKEFSGSYRRAYEICESVEIVLLEFNGNIKIEGPYKVNSLEELYEVDDELYAYCLDPECLNIGKRCVLARDKIQ